MQFQFSIISLLLFIISTYIGLDISYYLLTLLPTFLAIIWPKRILKHIVFLLNLFFILLLVLETGHLLIYDTLPTPGVYIALFETDFHESWEFLASQNLYLIFGTMFAICLAGLGFSLKSPRWNRKYAIACSALVAIISLAGFQDFHRKSPFRLITYFQHYQKEAEAYKLFLSKKFTAPLKINSKNYFDENTVVFVLGESTTRNRMSLYDYKRDTTPRLKQDKDLVVFKNIVSPHTQTHKSLKKVLTLLNHDNEKSLSRNTHIIALAKAAGYKTFWISNQKALGKYENPHTVIARNSHEIHWLNDGVNSSKEQYDEKILPALERVLNKTDSKKFIVIHLMGTHTLYRNRYPDSFEQFKDIFHHKNLKLNSDQEKIYNEYDNAVFYQDYVLSEVFRIVRGSSKNYSLIYFPDHGEEALQDAYLVGHTEARATQNMYEIPMLFDSSTSTLKKIAASRIQSFWSTEDFIQVLHSLLGVDSQYYEEERDILSERFKEKGPPKRALGKI